MSARGRDQDHDRLDAGTEFPQDEDDHHEPASNPTGPGSWRRDASGRWTAQGAPKDPVEQPDEDEPDVAADSAQAPPPSRSARAETRLVDQSRPSSARVLSQAHFQALSDVPAVMVWLANIDNPNTRRAYQGDLEDFLGFCGIETPGELRDVTRAHVIAWRACSRGARRRGHARASGRRGRRRASPAARRRRGRRSRPRRGLRRRSPAI